jgi:hypothetical protein
MPQRVEAMFEEDGLQHLHSQEVSIILGEYSSLVVRLGQSHFEA